MIIDNCRKLEKVEAINNLFKTKNYKSIIGSKSNNESIVQNLLYYNRDNITEKFIINIIKPDLIETEVPIYNTNYYYTTNFNNLDKLYNYLLLHL
tara:strand:+ start:1340 stop:1624 length:285 start_codon:yes stop_codon:yes gene_type:complete